MPPNLRTTALFLSTLSLRRATIHSCSRPSRQSNFYPRSPCGERRGIIWRHIIRCRISIHALLAESDPTTRQPPTTAPHFYPRSPCGERRKEHAIKRYTIHFYPRSPCGERREKVKWRCSIHDFYPRSPCGERPTDDQATTNNGTTFLSTLSLRRATSSFCPANSQRRHFYPRSPCGERQVYNKEFRAEHPISIHALLAESDFHRAVNIQRPAAFLSTLSLRRATKNGSTRSNSKTFLSTLSLRRATLNGFAMR